MRNTLRVVSLLLLLVVAVGNPFIAGADEECYNCVSDGQGGSECEPGEEGGYTECEIHSSGVGCTPNGGAPCQWEQ
jgi:hypothetical protein